MTRERNARRQNLTILCEGIFYFILTALLIIASAEAVLSRAEIYAPSRPVSIWYILLAFAVATFLLVIFVKNLKSKIFFEIFFTIAIFAGIWFLADIWFRVDLAVLVAVLVTALKFIYKPIWWQNLVMVLGIAGVVVVFGLSVTWFTALILLAILSFYDIVAVYLTGHMVKMFEGLFERGVVFALILPSQVHDFFKSYHEAKLGSKYMFLGSGDLALPGIFIACLVRISIWQGIFAALGAIIGFALMEIIFSFQKKRKPMPALPPIAAGTILGFAIAVLFNL